MGEQKRYEICFTIPQIKSALLMGPEGGGQLKIEFDQTSRAAVVAMLDRATERGGCAFVAVAVEIDQVSLKESNENGSTETSNRAADSPTRMVRRRVQRPTD